MKDIKIESTFTVFEDLSELPEEIVNLMQYAIEARMTHRSAERIVMESGIPGFQFV